MATSERPRVRTTLPGDPGVAVAGLIADGILHELANGVFLARNLAELALQELPEDAALRPTLAGVLAAAEEQTELIRAYQRFGAAPPEPNAFSLDEAVADVVALLRLGGALRRVEVVLDAEEAPVVGVAQARVEQLALALLVEAVRGCADGGSIRVTVRDGVRPELRVAASGPRRARPDPWPAALANELAAALGCELLRDADGASVAFELPELS